MTEAEWLACSDPHVLLLYFRNHPSERKLRLFGAACCRRVWDQLTDRRSRRAVEVAERFADQLATHEEAENVKNVSVIRSGRGIEHAATLTLGEKPYLAGVRIIKRIDPFEVPAEEAEQCRLLRDIFGNPFRPVAFEPVWRTSDVLLLARGIYDDRAFDRMPILADALQDAGCDATQLLEHCRGDGPHARGCWVVDLVLEKE